MATFSSPSKIVNSSAASVADKFSDFTAFQKYIDMMPAEERAKVGDVSLTADSIVMHTPQVGDITLKVTERTPSCVRLTAQGSPVPMNIALDIKPVAEDKSELQATMDVDIPAFLKPMIGGTLQKAVDQFGALMEKFV